MKKTLILLLLSTLVLGGCSGTPDKAIETTPTPFMLNLPNLIQNTEAVKAYNVIMEESIRTKTMEPNLLGYLGYTVTQADIEYFLSEMTSLEDFYSEQEFTLMDATIESHVFVDRVTTNITSYIVVHYPSGLIKILSTLFIEGVGYTLTYE